MTVDGKDALLSVTNIGAVASLIVAVLATQGIITDVGTVAAVVTFGITVIGRWRAGGIKSAAGVSIPQPAKPEGQL